MKEIENYINSFDNENIKIKLNELYSIFTSLMPKNANETISYGIPTFTINNINIIHFGGAKNHVAIYPGSEIVESLQNEIAKLNLDYSKGTIKFKLDHNLPKEFIAKITKIRLSKITN